MKHTKNNNTFRWIIWSLLVVTSFEIQAQEDAQSKLSAQAANPLADLISFPLQNNLNINHGEFNRNVNVLNIQPVVPFAGGKIITRAIFPIVSIPDFSSESGTFSSGLSDIVLTTFYSDSPTKKENMPIGK